MLSVTCLPTINTIIMLLFDVGLGWVRFAHVSRGLGWVGSITMAYFTTIVTRLFDENDIFISLESSINALQDGCSIFVGYKI